MSQPVGQMDLHQTFAGFQLSCQDRLAQRIEHNIPQGQNTIAAADVAFHDIIVEATGNRRLVQLINNLSEQMYRYRFEYIKDESGHDNLVNEHRMIYESIIRQDKGKAAEAAKLHIDNQEKSVIRQIRLEQEHAAPYHTS